MEFSASMSADTAIRVTNLSKCYWIYDHPGHRMRYRTLFPRDAFAELDWISTQHEQQLAA